MDMTDEETGEDFNWDAAARECGCTERQMRFAQEVMLGANNTLAAERAGYAGEGASLRSAGYSAAHSKKVQRLIAMAEMAHAGLVDGVLEHEDRKLALSGIARNGSPGDRIAAIRALEQIEERENAADPVLSNEMLLEKIAAHAPLMALELAAVNNLDFKLPIPVPEALEKLDALKAKLLRMSANGAAPPQPEAPADMPSETANEAPRTP